MPLISLKNITEVKFMESFEMLFKQDMERYLNKPTLYIKVLLFFLRKAQTTNNRIKKTIYLIFYRGIASHRGLEISSSTQIGGGISRPCL